MSNSFYFVRNYCAADFKKYVQLRAEAERLEPSGRCISPETVKEQLRYPHYSPEQDLFIVEAAGNIVGYLSIVSELIISRAVLDCFIHRDHRRRGLATKLFNDAVQRAEELGVKVAQVNIPRNNSVAKTVLSRLGFHFVRRFFYMRLDITKVSWQNDNQSDLRCCRLQPGEEDKLAQIQNRSFTGTWGYNPNTVEEIKYFLSSGGGCREDVVLIYDGDTVGGYCWTKITGGSTTGERKGYIHMIGIDPTYQGKGAGKTALLAGLSLLESKGLKTVELTVDSRNKTARALYRSVGFKVWTSNLWYEKVID